MRTNEETNRELKELRVQYLALEGALERREEDIEMLQETHVSLLETHHELTSKVDSVLGILHVHFGLRVPEAGR